MFLELGETVVLVSSNLGPTYLHMIITWAEG